MCTYAEQPTLAAMDTQSKDIAPVLEKLDFDNKPITKEEAKELREFIRSIRTNTKDKPP